jgi:hypothetical protein
MQIYAGFDIFIFKILWEGPRIPLSTQKEEQNPYPPLIAV